MMKFLDDLAQVIKRNKLYLTIFCTICAFAIVSVGYLFFLKDRIAPNVYVNNLNIGFLSKDAALSRIKIYPPDKLTLTYKDANYDINLDEVEFEYDYVDTINQAYKVGRSGNLIDDFINKIASLYKPTIVEYSININEDLLTQYLSVISGNVVEEPVLPSITKNENGFLVSPGTPGTTINTVLLKSLFLDQLVESNYEPIHIVTTNTLILNNEELEMVKTKADVLFTKSLTGVYEDELIKFSDLELAQTLLPQNGVNPLIQKTKTEVDREPQNAVFTFVDSLEGESKLVKEFKPAKNGLAVDEVTLKKEIEKSIDKLISSDVKEINIYIPVQTAMPEITTESVNDHGIRELIGQGKSRFVGSIPSRIHNVGVASARFNGVLVAPGEVLSFNEIVGDISVLTGYQKAYIIKDGATVLGDGGGVCQVSTTLFRAALDAGLPIVERRAHSYRVSYYEQDSGPGIDATVYAPTTDLKIANDTPAFILMQTYYDPSEKTLEFEFYGTSDGRTATITKPVITGSTPPPEDMYIDDPNMKVGEIKQIDWKAWGAKVNFDYKVERDGQIIYEKTFYSNYQPWQAKFLRGTAAI